MTLNSVVCIDHAGVFSSERWNPLSARGYQCRFASNRQEALALATGQHVDAIILRCQGGVTQLVMEIKCINPTIPIILLSDRSVEPCSISQIEVAADADHNIVAVDTTHNIEALVSILRGQLVTPYEPPDVARPIGLSLIQWPFSAIAARSGRLVGQDGITTMIGEGGMCGKLEGVLSLGEMVLIEFSNAPEDPRHRAQVIYCDDNIYGFAFHKRAWSQRGPALVVDTTS